LLVLARADAGQELPLEPVALQPIIEEVCRQAQALSPNRTVVSMPAGDGSVMANRDALKQVLLILLDNATRHTQDGAAIRVTTSASGDRLSISVADSGPGISPSVLPHIFRRFYRGEVSRSGQGAGLGLSIAKELVELQHGAIAVSSEAGRGATFTVTLPAATRDGDAL
jgi:two-component system OmpR family sensor kinase